MSFLFCRPNKPLLKKAISYFFRVKRFYQPTRPGVTATARKSEDTVECATTTKSRSDQFILALGVELWPRKKAWSRQVAPVLWGGDGSFAIGFVILWSFQRTAVSFSASPACEHALYQVTVKTPALREASSAFMMCWLAWSVENSYARRSHQPDEIRGQVAFGSLGGRKKWASNKVHGGKETWILRVENRRLGQRSAVIGSMLFQPCIVRSDSSTWRVLYFPPQKGLPAYLGRGSPRRRHIWKNRGVGANDDRSPHLFGWPAFEI